MIKNFKGEFKDLKYQIGTGVIDLPEGMEVELIVKPAPPPPGFEKMMPKLPPDREMEGAPEGKGMCPPAPNRKKDGIPPAPIGFQRKLDSIMKDNTIHRPAGNKRFGDLDTKHLYRFATTGRCFHRKDIISNKTYNIALVLDGSGSMQGDQCELAGKCGEAFVRDFQKKAEVAVYVFNVDQTLVKPFHKKLKEDQLHVISDILYSECHAKDKAYGNHDHMALRRAWEDLQKTRGKKIIVILSDGEPACNGSYCNQVIGGKKRYPGCEYNLHKSLKDEIKKIEKQGGIILGLGILNSQVENYYTDWTKVKNLPDMYSGLITLLSRVMRRGASV